MSELLTQVLAFPNWDEDIWVMNNIPYEPLDMIVYKWNIFVYI